MIEQDTGGPIDELEPLESRFEEDVYEDIEEFDVDEVVVRVGKRDAFLEQKPVVAILPDGYQFDLSTRTQFAIDPFTSINIGMLGQRKRTQPVDFAEEQSLSEFSREIRRFPLLNRELEQIIFTHHKKGGSIADLRSDTRFWEAFGDVDPEQIKHLLDSSSSLRDLVVNSNMRLVFKIANRYKGKLPMSDMIAEGAIGMQKAFDKFDIDKGFKFSTYATWWIRQSISRAAIDIGPTIRIPVHAHDALNSLKRIIEAFEGEYGRNPQLHELVELANINGIERKQAINLVLLAFSGGYMDPASLDMPVGEDGEHAIGDLLNDPNSQEKIFVSLFQSANRDAVEEALLKLNKREREVLELRFGFDGRARTLEEVGREIGVTRERIRQIEAKALRKLRSDPGLIRANREHDDVIKPIQESVTGRDAESKPIHFPQQIRMIPRKPVVVRQEQQKTAAPTVEKPRARKSIYEIVEKFYDNGEFVGYEN